MIPYINQLRNKVNTLQPNSKLSKDLGRMLRDLDDGVTRAEGMADLINKYGYNKLGIPRTWEDMFKVIDNEIAAEGLKRKAFKAELETVGDMNAKVKIHNSKEEIKGMIPEELGLGKDYKPKLLDENVDYTRIDLKRPVFHSDADEASFYHKIDDFLKKNNLGHVDYDTKQVVVSNDRTIQDIDDLLDAMNKPDLKTKNFKDWHNNLRKSVRDALGTEGHKPGQPSQTFAQSQRNLEHLFNEKTLLNRISGGQGINPSPNKISFMDRISPATAPAFGLIDFNPNIISRNIGQAGVNLVDRAEDIQQQIQSGKEKTVEVNEILKSMGLDTPEKIQAYFESLNAMPLTIE
jgi:hypothetical protein